MEFNKPVSNPMMVGSIELLKAEDTPEHRQMFLDELQKAKFLSPVVIDPVPVPDENGRVTIARDAKVQFPMLSTEDGRKFFMAFTDWTELKRWRDEENQQTFAMNFDDYAGMLLRKDAQGNISPALGFVINPFGGNIVATIVNPEHRPQMATVRSGVMQKSIYEGECKKEVVYPEVSKYVPAEDFVVKVLDHHVEAAKHNLKGSAIVVAGGYGVGSKEGFDQLFELAHLLHGEVGASRAAVDAGWVDHDRQIGQTGVTVHPKVYIACGISGQIQHIAGMQDSGIIISVNNDPDAPINKIADYVINGNVEDVVPKLIKYYKQNSK